MAADDDALRERQQLALEAIDAVHIASTGRGPGVDEHVKGFPLHLPDLSPGLALQAVRQEALRWTYLLRSRKRWVADRRARERNEAEARDALERIGVDPTKLDKLSSGEVVVVRIPWKSEPHLWEARVFPWEYVLAAATRQRRLEASSDCLPPQLTVMRELQRHDQPRNEPLKVLGAVAATPDESALTVLFVECVPSELARQWSVCGERERLEALLPKSTRWVALCHPTPFQLYRAVKTYQPQLIHFAGLDSHQGLRELRLYFGSGARVDLNKEWLDTIIRADVADNAMEAAAASRRSATGEDLALVDDVVADPKRMVDGVLLRNLDGMPLLVPAHELAQLLHFAFSPAWLVTFNLWNSAARTAALVVAEGAAAAAVGFQDAFDDSLADFVHATLYRQLLANAWNLPRAFISTWAEVRRLPESVDATGITLWTGAPVIPLMESPLSKVAPRKADAGLRCTVKPYPELNYAVLHNAQPLFEALVLECDDPRRRPQVDVEVEVHMGSETAAFNRRVTMDRSRVALTREVHVPLTAEVARSVHEAIGSSIAVRIESNGRTLYRDTHRLRLLPVDQWRDNRRDGRWLPSFVQPRDPAVMRAVEQAQRYNRVLRDDPNAGFEGYQLAIKDDEESLRGVDRQVEAIWATLLHDWQLGYINPPPAYSSALDSQRLRTPSMIREYRSGTCIDLALLLASCLELVDIYPVIFLLEGHALPGWWRHPDYRDEYSSMADERLAEVVEADATHSSVASAQVVAWHTGKASYSEIRRWIRQRKLVPIETVRLTENCGFVEAVEAGIEALSDRRDFDSMLEIVTARYEQVTPLPLLKESS